MEVGALPPALRDEVLLSALGHEKNPLAVLVSGSYAQGRAEGDSDLDLVVLTQLEPEVSYRTWFVERSGRPLHVSAAFETMTCWLARREEPAGWSLGLPTATPTPYLWKTAAAVEVLGDEPKLRRPRAEPELEDFVEAAVKVRRAVREGAYARARWHAHLMAELAPRLLLSLNPERRVVHVWDAVRAALDLPIAPVHYRQDMNAGLGLSTVSDERIAEAGLRLPCEMLAFLRQHDPDVDPQPWLSQYLRDGTLQRLLED